MIHDYINKVIRDKRDIYSSQRIAQYERVLELTKDINSNRIDQEYANNLFNKMTSLGLSNSTAITYIKVLISSLNYNSVRSDIKLSKILRGVRDTSDSEKVFLTREELLKIRKHKASTTTLDKVKDLFLFCCYTGMRHNEAMRLNTDNIISRNGIKIIRYTTSKNNKTNEVPINDVCRSIISKYGNSVVPKLSNAKANEYLHSLLYEIGFRDKIQKVHYIGKNRIEKAYMKCDLITFHNSRHTFVSNLIDMGMSFQDISDIIGVSTMTLSKWYAHSNTDTRNRKALDILNNL